MTTQTFISTLAITSHCLLCGCEELGIELPPIPDADVAVDAGDTSSDIETGTDAHADTSDARDGSDASRSCMEDPDGDGVPNVYPPTGPVSAGDYSTCREYEESAILTYYPDPLCDSERWKYVLETRGVAAGGTLYSLDNAGGSDNQDFWWHEEHPLELDSQYPYGSSEPGGWWQRYTLLLPTTDDFSAQSSGVDTFHSCQARGTGMLWGVTLHDEQETVVDCVILAASPMSEANAGDIVEIYPELDGCDVLRWQGPPEPVACAEDNDLDGMPDVFPETGPISAGDYSECPDYRGSTVAAHLPKPECNDQEWSYVVETRGTADKVVVYLLDSAGGSSDSSLWWSERHELGAPDGPSMQFGPGDWWSRFELDLSVTEDFRNQEDGVNSLMTCSVNGGQTLVWGVEVYEDDEVVDCVKISESETTDPWLDDLDSEFPQLSECETLTGWSP